MTEPLLHFLDAGLSGRVDRANLEITAGEITMITGPSGAGKSSILRLANGLERPDVGGVFFRGTKVSDVPPRAHRRQVALVFQQPVMFAGTVADNIDAATPTRSPSNLLDSAGLDASFLARNANELSGGEKQRVALARSLGTDPDVLLLDEPTSALDEASTGLIEASTRAFVDQGGSVVWVTHDQAQVTRLADRVVTMRQGRIQ